MLSKLPHLSDRPSSDCDLQSKDFDHIDRIAITLAEDLINLYSASSWRLSTLDISKAPLRIAKLVVSHLENHYGKEASLEGGKSVLTNDASQLGKTID